MSEAYFISDKNLLKRDSSTGSTTLSAPSSVGSWGTKVVSHTVNHNLGYIPMVRVYYTPRTDGQIYPATGDRVGGTGLGLSSPEVFCLWELSTTTLTIYLECNSFDSPTGTRDVYWVIYKDTPV
jgi:hypothetical protein